MAICIDYPIYCLIKKNKPGIDNDLVWKITDAIKESATRYGISKKIMAAIFMQESSYKISAVNKKSRDYGIGQINIKTAQHYKFCVKRLNSDLDYSVKATAKVLADLRQKFPNEPDYWTRYHSWTKQRRELYKVLVERHLKEEL